ncbi:MAG: hypothetical protein OXG64_08740 [Chloroflexi bacterium]|nr:hypothetical protein [Chloroflexota bacterium]
MQFLLESILSWWCDGNGTDLCSWKLPVGMHHVTGSNVHHFPAGKVLSVNTDLKTNHCADLKMYRFLQNNGVSKVAWDCPAAPVAKLLELLVPVLATGWPETPDSGMEPDEPGGCFITGGIGIKPAPDVINPQTPDPWGKAGCRTGTRDHKPDVGQFRQGEHRQGIDRTFGQQGRTIPPARKPEPAQGLP